MLYLHVRFGRVDWVGHGADEGAETSSRDEVGQHTNLLQIIGEAFSQLVPTPEENDVTGAIPQQNGGQPENVIRAKTDS